MKRRKHRNRNPRRYQRWTLDELREVETSVSLGHATIGIAAALGRSINAIKHALHRHKGHGLQIERQTLTIHGYRALAAAFGVGWGIANRWIKAGWIDGTYDKIERFIRNPKYWPFWEIERMTDPDLQAIARRYRGRMEWLTVDDAAKVYGVCAVYMRKLARTGKVEAEYLANGKWIIKNLEG